MFRTFVVRLMSLHHQLHQDYHNDRQIRHRLLTSVDIATICDSIHEQTPLSSHQLSNRVENRLFTSTGTAGTVPVLLVKTDQGDHKEAGDT